METESKSRQVPPPPSPRLPGRASATSRSKATSSSSSSSSITREEIRRFWIQRKMKEEEHLLAAEKAAARIKARVLTQRDYEGFEASLKRIAESMKDSKEGKGNNGSEELRTGIKDWWTKSKYAYLNQPAIKEDACRACNTYIPNPSFHLRKSVLGVF